MNESKIDGVKITSDQSFASLIRNKKVGDTVNLKINHKGEEKIVMVKLEEMK